MGMDWIRFDCDMAFMIHGHLKSHNPSSRSQPLLECMSSKICRNFRPNSSPQMSEPSHSTLWASLVYFITLFTHPPFPPPSLLLILSKHCLIFFLSLSYPALLIIFQQYGNRHARNSYGPKTGEYLDFTCAMGGWGGTDSRCYNAPHMWGMGWSSPAQVVQLYDMPLNGPGKVSPRYLNSQNILNLFVF